MKSINTIHLICNAHIDPVWQWEWEEGAAEAVSTFRVAADFCEEFESFIFCHNEALLYEWIEEYEPTLFKRIQKLVKAGKWHIMGGWYLQPDCNMPCGESFVRQILLGREYFSKKFNKRPTTTINFDPFGHSRGLVQILAKSGFDSYLFCRPHEEKDCPLPAALFEWEGFDGSRIKALRCWGHYSSERGKAANKIKDYIKSNHLLSHNLVLWGIGNHGGGPSHEDLGRINKLIAERTDVKIKHSTPENYFKNINQNEIDLPKVTKSLNPWGVGCYTSQIKIKQFNRQLENELFATEKMLVAAWQQGLMKKYPSEQLNQVMRHLAMVQFHDILPGTSVEEVEKSSIRIANHGLDILSSLKAKAFFALSTGQKKGSPDNIPLLVYNPHPFPVKTIVECEYQLPDMQRIEDGFHIGKVYQNGTALPSQMKKEASTILLDWRKRVAFEATLAPSQMNRFDCHIIKEKSRPAPKTRIKNGKLIFKTNDMQAIINTRTGLLSSYKINNKEMLSKPAFRPIVMHDNEDPWGMLTDRYDKVAGKFKLLAPEKSAEFSGLANRKKLPAVRVIEDGEVYTTIEAVFGYNDSFICQQYTLPKNGTQINISCKVIWNEKDKMLKLDIPVNLEKPSFLGQVAYGVEKMQVDGAESIAQKWIAATDKKYSVTLINDGTYGCDFRSGSLRPTLLRSPAYCAHPVHEFLPVILPQDRFLPRSDTGYRCFNFAFNAGPPTKRLSTIDREATIIAEKPMALSFFPSGQGKKQDCFIKISGNIIQLAAIKKAMRGNGVIVRLFNPTDKKQKTTISLPTLKIKRQLSLKPHEILSLKIDPKEQLLSLITIDENRL